MGSAIMDVLRALTTASSVAVGISPAPNYYRMYKQKSTGDMSILPVVALFGNCYLWMIYGYLVDNIVPLFAVCCFGASTSIAFMIIFYLYTNDRKFVVRLWVIAAAVSVVLAVYAAIGVAGVTNQSQDQVEKILGFFAVALNLCLYASPLATIRHVVLVKDAESMPITMSFVGLVNAALWVSVSTDDMFVLVPNGVGAVLSAVQIVLYLVYRPGKYSSVHAGTASIEDGLAAKIEVHEEEAGKLKSPSYVQAPATP